MIGLEKESAGVIIKEEHFRSVKKILKQDEQIPTHTHEGNQIIFVVVKGEFEALLAGQETHRLTPGKVLTFDGTNSIAGTALADTEIVVTLIQKM